MEEQREMHNSFGMLAFHRTHSSRGENLFGSSIRQHETIMMTVKRAEKIRHLNEDRFFAHEQIIEVELSPMQFAECITSLNCGDGIPCTIRYIGKERMDACPEVTFRQQFEDEFNETTQQISEKVITLIDKMKKMLEKNTMSKADRKEIIENLRLVAQDLSSNLPFIASQFNEAMDKVATDVKTSVEAFALHRITELGRQQLHNDLECKCLSLEALGDQK